MSLVAVFNLSGAEVILIAAFIFISFMAKQLPELAKGSARGTQRFTFPNHPVLMALTFVLGAVCFLLVVYEFSK